MARFRFDRFCLDAEQKLLLRGDDPVRLTPRAFRLLEFLLAQSPKAISKRDLMDQVWSGAIVGEASLKTLVLEIRSALHARGASADPIRTVFGFGYAFAGAVQIEERAAEPAPLAGLRWMDGAARLPAGSHIIGRAAHCAVIIDAQSVSREHAELIVSHDALRLNDLGSKNGTFVDGTRIRATTDLFDVCRITIGDVVVEVSRLGKDDSTETVDFA